MKCLRIFYRTLTAVCVYHGTVHTLGHPRRLPDAHNPRTVLSVHSTAHTAVPVYQLSPAHLCSSWSSFIPANWCCVVCKTARRAITLAANTHIAAQTGDEAEMKRRRLETIACLRNLRDVSAHHASLVYGIGGTMPLHADVYGT